MHRMHASLHYLLKYITPHIHTQHRLPIITINKHTLMLKQSIHYRHITPKQHRFLINPALLALAQNTHQPSTYLHFFFFVSKFGHANVIQLLLQDSRVDPSAHNNEAILWASKNGHIGVVKVFFEKWMTTLRLRLGNFGRCGWCCVR